MSLVCSPYTIYRPDIPSPHGAQVVLWSGGAGGATDRDNLTWIVLRKSSSAGEMKRLIKEWRDATRFLSNVSKKISHPIYNLLPTEIEGFDNLAELALDMHWSWDHSTDEVWRQLDPKLWEITHNPWVVLQTVSRDQIEGVLADPVFRKNDAKTKTPKA